MFSWSWALLVLIVLGLALVMSHLLTSGNTRPTHCYSITHGGIRMWPPGWHPGVDEEEARDQFKREKCSTLGNIELWSFALVWDEEKKQVLGYDPKSARRIDLKTCA